MTYRFIGQECVLESHDGSHKNVHFQKWGSKYELPEDVATMAIRDLDLPIIPDTTFAKFGVTDLELKTMTTPEAQARRGTDEFMKKRSGLEAAWRELVASLQAAKAVKPAEAPAEEKTNA